MASTSVQDAQVLKQSLTSHNLTDTQVEIVVYYSDLKSILLEEKESDDFMTLIFDGVIIIAAFTGLTIASCCEGLVCLVYNCCCKKHHSSAEAVNIERVLLQGANSDSRPGTQRRKRPSVPKKSCLRPPTGGDTRMSERRPSQVLKDADKITHNSMPRMPDYHEPNISSTPINGFIRSNYKKLEENSSEISLPTGDMYFDKKTSKLRVVNQPSYGHFQD